MPRQDMIRARRGTAAEWALSTDILYSGELAWASDTNEFKLGDGFNTFSALPSVSADAAIAAADAAADAAAAAVTANAAIPLTQKGAASGVATLDSGGVIPVAQVPLSSPANDAAVAAFVTGGGPTETALNTTYVRFLDENGDPLTGKLVTITVDSTAGTILDIASEDI